LGAASHLARRQGSRQQRRFQFFRRPCAGPLQGHFDAEAQQVQITEMHPEGNEKNAGEDFFAARLHVQLHAGNALLDNYSPDAARRPGKDAANLTKWRSDASPFSPAASGLPVASEFFVCFSGWIFYIRCKFFQRYASMAESHTG
jgi:hypothetical protein